MVIRVIISQTKIIDEKGSKGLMRTIGNTFLTTTGQNLSKNLYD